jgi:hypothetical protein
VCFHKALLVGYGWYGKYYQNETGHLHTYFEKPRELQDTDPIMLHIVSSVRKWAGLEEALPYARTTAQPVILVASRSKLMRNRYIALLTMPWIYSPAHAHSQVTSLGAPRFKLTSQCCRAGITWDKRLLLNEEDLVANLSTIPDVIVKQVCAWLFACTQVRVADGLRWQVEFYAVSLADMAALLGTVDVFIGYHGAAFDNTPFLARGAYVIEIMPNGSTHEPLYATKACTTGKFFVRCVAIDAGAARLMHADSVCRYRYTNDDASREVCQKPGGDCNPHDLDLTVDIAAIMKIVPPILEVQKLQMRQYR